MTDAPESAPESAPPSTMPATPRPPAVTPAVLALTYDTSNVGDDIQTLAMLQHAPLGAEIVWHDRDHLAEYDGPPARLVANGWWAHGERAWPPPPIVDVLCTSMHVQQKSRPMFERGGLPFSGVGARDTDTLAWLDGLGVDAHFSACMTLTFPRSTAARSKFIVAVDLRGRDLPAVRNAAGDAYGLIRATHTISRTTSREDRLSIAEERLALYRSAALVVTTRLHAALPCVAMGTPVLLVGQSSRFSGLDAAVTIAPRVTPEALAAAIQYDPAPYVRPLADNLAAAAKEYLAPCSI